MNITFITSLDFTTYKPYTEQPMPMVESLFNKRLYKIYELMKTLDDIDPSSHKWPYESGKLDQTVSSDEGEQFLLISPSFRTHL